MKTTLLLLLFITFGIQAQTTHDLNWRIGIGTNVDLTINTGDTVRWTWTDSAPHTVESDAGSTETFNSGSITGNGSTYSYTFTVEGSNPYLCAFHPGTMRGTITVENALSFDEIERNSFNILPNPATTRIDIKLSEKVSAKTISVYNLIGQKVLSIENAENPIDISPLRKGIYLLNISSETLNHTKRFVKL